MYRSFTHWFGIQISSWVKNKYVEDSKCSLEFKGNRGMNEEYRFLISRVDKRKTNCNIALDCILSIWRLPNYLAVIGLGRGVQFIYLRLVFYLRMRKMRSNPTTWPAEEHDEGEMDNTKSFDEFQNHMEKKGQNSILWEECVLLFDLTETSDF